MFADVYRECQKVGIHPREADEMFLWEVAVVLGADLTEEAEQQVAQRTDPRALLRARLAHSQGLGPKPEAAPMTYDEVQSLMGALGTASV